jgi:hypothetical protein
MRDKLNEVKAIVMAGCGVGAFCLVRSYQPQGRGALSLKWAATKNVPPNDVQGPINEITDATMNMLTGQKPSIQRHDENAAAFQNQVKMENAVFWDVTLCGSCKTRRFGGTYGIQHLDEKNSELGTFTSNSQLLTMFLAR